MVSSLTACGTPVKKLEISTAPVDRVPLDLPNVDELKLDKLEWILITPDTADKVFAKLDKKGYDYVLFGLTDKGYESLSMNQARTTQLLKQQRAVILAYKSYYEKQTVELERLKKDQERVQKEVKKHNQDIENKNKKDNKIVNQLKFWKK